MRRSKTFWKVVTMAAGVGLWAGDSFEITVSGQGGGGREPVSEAVVKGRPVHDLLSTGGHAALFPDHALGDRIIGTNRAGRISARDRQFGFISGDDIFAASDDDEDRGGANVFVNDPCLDPPPTAPEPERRRRTVQSEDEIAVLNAVDSTQGTLGSRP